MRGTKYTSPILSSFILMRNENVFRYAVAHKYDYSKADQISGPEIVRFSRIHCNFNFNFEIEIEITVILLKRTITGPDLFREVVLFREVGAKFS